jgi:hypothetical protein
MRESDLQQAILREFGSRPDLRIWRANVIAARTRDGRVVRAGIKGQADISGIMLPTGRRVEIEVKGAGGTLTREQERWRDMIRTFGGAHCVARSLEDVREFLKAEGGK